MDKLNVHAKPIDVTHKHMINNTKNAGSSLANCDLVSKIKRTPNN